MHVLKPKLSPDSEEYVLEQLSVAEQKLVGVAEELASRDQDTIRKEMEDEEVRRGGGEEVRREGEGEEVRREGKDEEVRGEGGSRKVGGKGVRDLSGCSIHYLSFSSVTLWREAWLVM